MSQRIVTNIQLLNHHDKPSSYVSAVPPARPQQQQQKARPAKPSLRRPHHQTWTLIKNLPLMDAAPSPDKPPRHSKEVNAVVQVHASLRNKMLPPGPLDGSAELIYMTNIARSNAPGMSPDPGKDTDELMFMLEHRPETIRFWIDERPVGHPSVSKEIRRGVLDDSRNCSVIKVCLNGGRAATSSCAAPSLPKESDIYLPPSTRAARVWIYLDPTKNQNAVNQEKTKLNAKNKDKSKGAEKSPAGPLRRAVSLKMSQKQPQKPSPTSLQHQPEKAPSRNLPQDPSKHHPETQPQLPPKKAPHGTMHTRQPPTSYGIPIPTRRSSKRATKRSPLSTNPPTTLSPGPPEPSEKDSSSEHRRVPSTRKAQTHHQPKARRSKSSSATTTTTGRVTLDSTARPKHAQARQRDPADESEPEDFRNDLLNDISRLMTTNSDPFGRFHNNHLPDMTDSEGEGEGRDYYPTTTGPPDGMPTKLSQAQLGKFYKLGKRAQSSIFFEEEALPGKGRKIEVSHVEKPGAKREFTKPSMIRRLRITLAGGWLKRAGSQKKQSGQ
ncbi:uncharacterized protein BKCO1_4400031 [Diplodia corticola]|uniref:Transmembrane protein n=1 Tax=Diplodia corticola TaxID=236234 RepID=A0A1J9QUY1_9PEZI|nr:uncharacterized protein BKCO1_4400031 [Diplodia corticola]OJD31778.1 transmembrane protein [Diplodia corticola]